MSDKLKLYEMIKMLEQPTADPQVAIPLEAWKLRQVAQVLREQLDSKPVRYEYAAAEVYVRLGMHDETALNEIMKRDLARALADQLRINGFINFEEKDKTRLGYTMRATVAVLKGGVR